MRRMLLPVLVLFLLTTIAIAAKKESGSTTLKDIQPAGTTGKEHKKQQYDLTFSTPNNEYTCRTNEKEKVNATNWVVGSSINYQVNGNKGAVKNLQSGKSAKCTIVRVAALTANPQ